MSFVIEIFYSFFQLHQNSRYEYPTYVRIQNMRHISILFKYVYYVCILSLYYVSYHSKDYKKAGNDKRNKLAV